MPAMTHCPRCQHSSVVRSYDGIICLLCGYEIEDAKEPAVDIEELIRNSFNHAKRGPRLGSHHRHSKSA